jgi:hypothetical protein
MLKGIKLLLLIALLISFVQSKAFCAFIISSEEPSEGKNVYSYRFASDAVYADYTVFIDDEKLYFPTDGYISINIVDEPSRADLIFVDNTENCSVRVYKETRPLSYIKSIYLSDNRLMALYDSTIKIHLSKNASNAKYNLFIKSSIFTNEEAAAIFAVIWQSNRNR